MDLLEVKGLKKYFYSKGFLKPLKTVKAVDGVSFTIRQGEVFGLVGESGCGKSTTGRTILNLHEPTGGSVRFDGTDIFDVEKKAAIKGNDMMRLRKDMQIIFQDPYASLDPRYTVGDIISEGMLKHKMYGKKQVREVTEQLLHTVGLSADSAAKYPHEFSGGQRQRIGIARALALQSKLIIGDEPVAALDVSIQAQILHLLLELKSQLELTYLFISHDLGVVKYFCDRVAVMYLGSIVELGSSHDLFTNAQHPYTQALLSATPKSHPDEIRDRIILRGDVPNPANPPAGCKFHTRCGYAQPECSQSVPVLKDVTRGHEVACHLVGSALQRS